MCVYSVCACMRALARARCLYTYSRVYAIKLKNVTESTLKHNFTGTRI